MNWLSFQFFRGILRKVPALFLAFSAMTCPAVSVTNFPVADTSLMEIAPENNNGAEQWLLSGRIQNDFFRNRALILFSFTNLPASAVIRSATLEISVTRIPGDGQANSPFALHRMLRPWGEGSKVALGNPGQGAPATEGEATWRHAFYPTNFWTEPGCAAGFDYAPTESAFQSIEDLGTYRFDSTPEMIDDIQDWLRRPESNFGWMLLCTDEGTIFTARRFGSREDPNWRPHLEIQFIIPPVIESAHSDGETFQFSFTTWPGQNYAVEFRDSLSAGTWQTLTNLGLATNSISVTVTDTNNASARFYRVNVF